MASNKNMIRIRLKAYDHQLIDKAAETIALVFLKMVIHGYFRQKWGLSGH